MELSVGRRSVVIIESVHLVKHPVEQELVSIQMVFGSLLTELTQQRRWDDDRLAALRICPRAG